MNERWSRLTLAMVPVLERILAKPLSEETRDLLEVLVADEGLAGESPPKWLVQLFQDIIERKSQRRKPVPWSQLRDENAFVNLLLMIEKELVWVLGFEDYGEGIEWCIPPCNVRVFIDRSTGNSLLNIFPI